MKDPRRTELGDAVDEKSKKGEKTLQTRVLYATLQNLKHG